MFYVTVSGGEIKWRLKFQGRIIFKKNVFSGIIDGFIRNSLD